MGRAMAMAGPGSGVGGRGALPVKGVRMGVGGGWLVAPGVTKTAVSGSGRSQPTSIKKSSVTLMADHRLPTKKRLIGGDCTPGSSKNAPKAAPPGLLPKGGNRSVGVPHEGASRPVRGEGLFFFSFWGHFDPKTEKTPQSSEAPRRCPCSR